MKERGRGRERRGKEKRRAGREGRKWKRWTGSRRGRTGVIRRAAGAMVRRCGGGRTCWAWRGPWRRVRVCGWQRVWQSASETDQAQSCAGLRRQRQRGGGGETWVGRHGLRSRWQREGARGVECLSLLCHTLAHSPLSISHTTHTLSLLSLSCVRVYAYVRASECEDGPPPSVRPSSAWKRRGWRTRRKRKKKGAEARLQDWRCAAIGGQSLPKKLLLSLLHRKETGNWVGGKGRDPRPQARTWGICAGQAPPPPKPPNLSGKTWWAAGSGCLGRPDGRGRWPCSAL